MFVELYIGDGNGDGPATHHVEISFPFAMDENGNVVKAVVYAPGDWVNVWEKSLLVDGLPHRLRLSVMEVDNAKPKEAEISGSSTPGSSGLNPEDFT